MAGADLLLRQAQARRKPGWFSRACNVAEKQICPVHRMPEALQAARQNALAKATSLGKGLSPTYFCALDTILNCFYEFMT
jgi:hypothetical protein